MIDTFARVPLSRRRALGWLGAGASGMLLSGCGGGGGGGSTGSASSASTSPTVIPTTPAVEAAVPPVVVAPVVDESALTLAQLAGRRGMQFGTPYLSAQHMNLPGPNGVGTLGDFFREQSSVYVNVMILPTTIEWTPGIYNTVPLKTFLALASQQDKPWRGHCLLYPAGDSAGVRAAVNSSNWRSMMTRHFEAIAAVPGAQKALNLDVTNELIDPNETATNSYRPNIWYNAASGPDYIVHAYKEARRLWPSTPLYWCHDQTEQLTDSWHINMAAANLRAIERAMNAGAPIDGYNMQGHLLMRLSFDPVRLRNFLNDLTKNLGLKILIGELDVHTGYKPPELVDTKGPEDYTAAEYDAKAADMVEKFLDVALPFVQTSGKQLICWGLCDVNDPWSAYEAERPMPWDENYQRKPMWSAIQRSLMRLPVS